MRKRSSELTPASDLLVRRHAGGHEQHLVEAELGDRFLGADQMADVDRVEGAAHDGEFLPVP